MTGDKRPLIVVCEVYTSQIYGAQRSMLQLHSEWHRQGRYRLHFVYPVPGELNEAVRALGIPVTHLPAGPLLSSFNKRLLSLRPWEYPLLMRELLSYARRLKRLIVGLGASLLHCNTDRAGLMCFMAARWAGCPMVTHMRRDRSFGWLDRLIYTGTNEVVWVSRRIQEEFAARNGVRRVKGRVIYNGRTLADADQPSTHAEVCAEFGLPGDAWIALVAASFDIAKDHETLVRAAGTACGQEPRLYFLMAGEDFTPGEMRRRKIESMVQEAGLSQRMLFLGHRRDISRLMRGADVLVNPSQNEALGGALIEAMGYGLPCVATDTGGTAEIVPPGRCGYLVPRGDYEALGRRTVELVRDPETRSVFSANARAHFAANFTVERCVRETGEFFDAIIAASGRRHVRYCRHLG